MEIKQQFEYGFTFNHSSELRFKELELLIFIEEMEKRFGPGTAKEHMVKLFQMVSDVESWEVLEMLDDLTKVYIKPQKNERVLFFLYYKGLSQYKTRMYTTMSPNFIQAAKERFEGNPSQIHPQAMDITIRFHPLLMEIKNILAIFPKINFE